MAKPPPAVLENVETIFRNFEGREDRYNPAGRRNFAVKLPKETADKMAKDGWSVKELAPREDDEEQVPTYFIKVQASYRMRAPKVILITYPDGLDGEKHMTRLYEQDVTMLDWADIMRDPDTGLPMVDCIITASEYEPGKTSAYLQSLYITIEEDPLEKKHGDLRLLGGAPPAADPNEVMLPPEMS